MNVRTSFWVSTLVIVGLAVLAWTRSTHQAAATTNTARPGAQTVYGMANPANGRTTIDQKQVPVVGELGRSLEQARESFLQMDF
jgi:hypothetical protein